MHLPAFRTTNRHWVGIGVVWFQGGGKISAYFYAHHTVNIAWYAFKPKGGAIRRRFMPTTGPSTAIAVHLIFI